MRLLILFINQSICYCLASSNRAIKNKQHQSRFQVTRNFCQKEGSTAKIHTYIYIWITVVIFGQALPSFESRWNFYEQLFFYVRNTLFGILVWPEIKTQANKKYYFGIIRHLRVSICHVRFVGKKFKTII